MRRLIRALLVSSTAVALLVAAAPSAGAAEPTGDPSADDYSPWVWINAWSTAGAIDGARAGDATEGLQHSGMVVAAVPDQLNALTAADKAQLDMAWHQSGLLQLSFDRARKWSAKAFQAVASAQPVPAWSVADADSVAGDLGGTSYAALSPGLKSVVQRVATIVTGDTKPVMPDEAWESWMPPQVRAGWDARPDTRFDWSGVSVTPPGVAADPASQVTTQCNAGQLNWLCHATQAVAGVVVATVDFVSNPLGYLAAAFSAAAAGMMTFVADVANHGTAPDLTASWWVSAYTKGMAIGVVLLGFVLLLETVQVARRRCTAEDLLETVSIWVPAWFAGVLFGPPVAQFLITGSGLLTDGIVSSMTGYGAGDAFTAVAQATRDGSQVQQAGELVMALLTSIGVLVSALMVFVSLCLQAVIVYLASAVFAVGWVWIVTQRHRDTAWRIPMLFAGVVFAKALLFFGLGVAMGIAAAATAMTGDGVAKNLGLIVMACAAMLLAAFAPLLLLKHAPVLPGTSTSREADGITGGAAARAGRDVGTAGRGARQGGRAGGKLAALAARGTPSGRPTTAGAAGGAGRGRAMAIATPYRAPGQGVPGGGPGALPPGEPPAPGAPQVGGRPGRPAITGSATSLAAQTAGPAAGNRAPGRTAPRRTFRTASTGAPGPVSSARRRIEQPPRRDLLTPPRQQPTGGSGSPRSSRLGAARAAVPGAAPLAPGREDTPPVGPPPSDGGGRA
jgi:hypothetical protein